MKSPFIICIAVLVVLSSIPMVSADDSILDILYKDIFGGSGSDTGGITQDPILSQDLISGKVPLKEGITQTKDTKVDLTSGDAAFTDKKSGAKVSTSVLVDNQKFVPEASAVKDDELVWSSDKAKDKEDYGVVFTYKYDGRILKETIILKKETDLKFPVTINDGYKIIPWDNGQWKIVSAISPYTMDGIVALKPSGIDADGKEIPMEYKWDGSSLNLVYDKTVPVYDEKLSKEKNQLDEMKNVIPQFDTVPITYPLTIDPTWVSYLSHWIDNTTIAGTTIEMWNTTGTTTWTAPTGVTSVWYLVVAGAASGGYHSSYGSGGGGAGGLLNGTLSVTAGNSYNIAVGTGGAGGNQAFNGTNSSFANTTAGDGINSMGGGTGGSYFGSPQYLGKPGGSGGGGYYSSSGTGGLGVSGQGNNGGIGYPASYSNGGGGGGAGEVGGVGSGSSWNSIGGKGGNGTQISITGTATYYAGGGGGSGYGGGGGLGGLGGGGLGGYRNGQFGSFYGGVSGTNGLGGGGGGSNPNDGTGSGSGGSGVVIIRYTAGGGVSAPSASFTVDRTVARIPGSVTVTDTSTNTPTSWAWQWGDGTANSTTQNPSHVYTKRGKYSIDMTATNAGGSGVATTATVRVVGYANE